MYTRTQPLLEENKRTKRTQFFCVACFDLLLTVSQFHCNNSFPCFKSKYSLFVIFTSYFSNFTSALDSATLQLLAKSWVLLLCNERYLYSLSHNLWNYCNHVLNEILCDLPWGMTTQVPIQTKYDGVSLPRLHKRQPLDHNVLAPWYMSIIKLQLTGLLQQQCCIINQKIIIHNLLLHTIT